MVRAVATITTPAPSASIATTSLLKDKSPVLKSHRNSNSRFPLNLSKLKTILGLWNDPAKARGDR